MSSYFDDASLVMIPSGYKTSKVYSVKPTDGSGDLTFSRSNDTATRVNSAGLIEKVRTNLVLQSNSFDTTWVSNGGSGSTVTSGQSDPDGGTSAWLLAKLSQTGRREQTITMAANEQTFSIVAKKGTSNFLYINVFDGTNSHDVYFNLDAGSVGTQSNAVGSIVSLGSGWYRCSVTSTNASASGIIQLFISDANGVVSGTTGNIYIYESQFENGVATDYIATTTAAVSVGPVSGLPRLDYLNSSCPRLILEPQRSNLQLNSESFNNATWTKTNSVVTANQIASPDGYINADKLDETTANNIHQLESSRTVTAAAYTMSVFAKKGERNFVRLYEDTTSNSAYFNLNTGTVGTVSGPTATAKIENYGNGWYRCSLTYTETGTFGRYRIVVAKQDNEDSYAGTAGYGIYIYGAQYELGAATSYIPTFGASVTRGADAASKSSINALIGGTSGTVFFEIKTNKTLTSTNFKQFFYYTDASASQAYMYLNGSNYIVTNTSLGNFTGSLQFQADTTYKVAIAYATNDFKLYINGVERGSSTSGTPINAVNLLSLGSYTGSAEFNEFVFSQYIHFPTRLSNSDLAALTA